MASSRYEPKKVIADDQRDRNWILLDWVGDGKRVLELGCSTGYLSRIMKQRNCVVSGIEADEKAAEQARAYCEEVFVLDLNRHDWTNSLRAKSFDVVLLGDVLEHLVDPGGLLRQVRGLIRTDGSLVISLPNVVHWQTRLRILFGQFDYQPWGTLDHTHLHFFTKKTAQALIESAGYRVVRFHPAFGGWMSGHARPVWHVAARLIPGLFAYQLLFESKKEIDPLQNSMVQNSLGVPTP
jgi:2-polyprenyl-3-methyl-5-hydroxy-6-metoxy-1,4-benzoquinol methylase